MVEWQKILIALYSAIAFSGFIKGLYECKSKKNSFGLTYLYRIYGAFVWADIVVFGLFWAIAGAVAIFRNDLVLFLLTVSLFWLVRSIGETLYWFNQQFSTLNRNPVKNFTILKNIFHNDSIWFVYQIFWQCMTVLFILSSLYLGKVWLSMV